MVVLLLVLFSSFGFNLYQSNKITDLNKVIEIDVKDEIGYLTLTKQQTKCAINLGVSRLMEACMEGDPFKFGPMDTYNYICLGK